MSEIIEALKGISGICFTFLTGMYMYKKICPNKEQEDEPINFNRVEYELAEMIAKAKKLRTVENLITDIEICESGLLHKTFTISWINEATGEEQSHDFYVTDSECELAEALRSAAEVDRYRLRTLLQNDIDQMPERSRKTLPDIVDITLLRSRKSNENAFSDSRKTKPKSESKNDNSERGVSA